MARPRKLPRLILRRRADGSNEWVIRDGRVYRRTGLKEAHQNEAMQMLRAYAARIHGARVANQIGPPVGLAPKRRVDALTVYFIGDGSAVKIGVAADLQERFYAIQAHCPQELSIYGVMSGGLSVERKLHKQFAAQHIRREWFRIEGPLLDYLRDLPDLSKLSGFVAMVPVERHPSSKLTPGQVEMIRQNPAGLSGREFARLFGMSEATISQAKSGIWWKHVA